MITMEKYRPYDWDGCTILSGSNDKVRIMLGGFNDACAIRIFEEEQPGIFNGKTIGRFMSVQDMGIFMAALADMIDTTNEQESMENLKMCE